VIFRYSREARREARAEAWYEFRQSRIEDGFPLAAIELVRGIYRSYFPGNSFLSAWRLYLGAAWLILLRERKTLGWRRAFGRAWLVARVAVSMSPAWEFLKRPGRKSPFSQ
jgi:hypothetical protein